MSNTSKQFTVLHLTDYGAPYEGNFVASLRALEARLMASITTSTVLFPLEVTPAEAQAAIKDEQ